MLDDLTSAASDIDEIGRQTLAVLDGKYGLQFQFSVFIHFLKHQNKSQIQYHVTYKFSLYYERITTTYFISNSRIIDIYTNLSLPI